MFVIILHNWFVPSVNYTVEKLNRVFLGKKKKKLYSGHHIKISQGHKYKISKVRKHNSLIIL